MKPYKTIAAFALALALSLGVVHSADASTWAFKGVVTEVNQDRIELMGTTTHGVAMWPKFRITHNTWVKNGVLLTGASEQVRQDARNEIRRGSVVTIWYTPGLEAMVIQNMAPQGLGEAYGPGDCSHCGK